MTLRLLATEIRPREREALAIHSAAPGITVLQLAERHGVRRGRASQVVQRREGARVYRAPTDG